MWHADVCINFFTQEKKMYETLKTKLINRQMIDSTKKCCGNPLMLQCSILICYCIIGQFFDNVLMNELPSHPLMLQFRSVSINGHNAHLPMM